MSTWTYDVMAAGEFGGFCAELVQHVRDDGCPGQLAIFVSATSWHGARQPRKVVEWYPGLPLVPGETIDPAAERLPSLRHSLIWMDWLSVMAPCSRRVTIAGDDTHIQDLPSQWLFHGQGGAA